MKTTAAILMTILCTSTAQPSDAAPRDHRTVKQHQQSVRTLPRGHYRIVHKNKSYYYSAGRFYRQKNGVYLSITAPLGVVIPTLPAGHVTFGIGPRRYYYHAGVYYNLHREGYIVTEKPSEAESVLASAGSDRVIIYPAAGQSEEQKRRDKYECHEWAFDETGFDPTDPESDVLLRADYQRAMGACLEARNYVVK